MGMFLLLAVLSLTIPTVSQIWGHSTPAGILAQSRGTALIIMCSYILWLVFQLYTHREMFEEPSQKVPKRPLSRKKSTDEALGVMALAGHSSAAATGFSVPDDDDDPECIPMLTPLGAVITIAFSTTVLAFHTEFAANSIQFIVENGRLSEKFLGIVILPLLTHDINSVICGIQDKLDLTLTLTVHRAMQTALMVAPLVVLIAWGMGIDRMTLDFDGFSVAALFASIIIQTYVISEGKSNWYVHQLGIKDLG